MVVFKPIIPSYSISFKVDDSGVHHGILRCLVMTEVMFDARNPSRWVSFFPSREVHPHAWLSEMSISFSCCWVSDMKQLGGFDDRGLGLEGWLRVAGFVLRLKGCPKDVLGGGSKLVGFRWVKEKKKDKGAAADFSSKKFQQ
ncbi:hypothetical protein BHM03_00002317 [Ensete ventricosum]|nr:hypothetical protein BHM03_00002317 [Ensete ventricosum]